MSVPPVLSVKSRVTDPKATSAVSDAVSEDTEHNTPSDFAPYAGSTPQSAKVVVSPRLGKPTMAANLAFFPEKSRADFVDQFRELGLSAGLTGRELADFVAERMDKHGDTIMRQRREEEEKLIQKKRESEEREYRMRREERERSDRLKKEEEERAIRIRELDLREQEIQNASQMASNRTDAEMEKWEAMFRALAERTTNPGRVATDGYRVRLEEWDDKQDIDQFLGHFERVASLHSWPREMWGVRLVPCLRGAAREAYLQMDITDADDYDKLKGALRQRFRRDVNFYRRRFRELRREPKETFPQFLSRLRTILDSWALLAEKDLSVGSEVLDMFLQEQILCQLHGDMETRVREEKVGTVEELVEVAQRLLEAKTASRSNKNVQGNQNQKQAGSNSKDSSKAEGVKGGLLCHHCGKPGHFKAKCPGLKKGAAVSCSDQIAPVKVNEGIFIDVVGSGTVNGQGASFLRDTGAAICMVASKFVDPATLTGEEIKVQLANCQVTTAPIAKVVVSSKFLKGSVKAAVFPELVSDFIVGNLVTTGAGLTFSVPIVPPREPRIEQWEGPKQDSSMSKVAVVTTRSKTAKGDVESPLRGSSQSGIETTAEELRAAQASDSTLARARASAKSGQVRETGGATVSFRYKNGILERVFQKGASQFRQVCVPTRFRKEVLRLAHDVPMAGHLANKKTRERVWGEFYWPSMCADIRRYCQSCDLCQKFAHRGRVTRVPLEKVPLVDTPFKKVAIDLVGPLLPSSERGKRYILVMVDYATRYPEAVALRNIDTESVAEALWEMWSRVGIPEEVLSDRGTQFTSGVMAEVYRLLSVKGLRTSPYHAQANGLVERFNGTLKSMLKKLCQERPKEWDRFLPAALFAYREVPQASTGFSPFELLFGRTVRGPMSVLKSLWTEQGQEEDVKHASAYVCDLRNRIEETCKVARESLERASQTQKRHFDRRAKPRFFTEGEEVLLLLPEKNNKLQMSWRGPYRVVQRVNSCDYLVSVRGNAKLYHANLLKRYVRRELAAVLPVAVASLIEEDEHCEVSVQGSIPTIPLKAEESVEDIQLDASAPETHQVLRELAAEFRDVLTDLPKCTTLGECEVRLIEEKPVRVKQYPLPFSQRETIKDEVEAMLRMGVIERSDSPFCSPIILVRKADGKMRFCTDLRAINQKVIFDAEPIPDVEYLFSKLGKAKYLSKLDLAKGYWQIPMKEEDKAKTAFSTPQGHFQWRVMPFGLKTAGAVFSRVMRKVVQPLNLEGLDNFMDDILLASEDLESHVRGLRLLFQRLRDVQLSVRPTKCFLGFRELEYLGHRVGGGRIRPEEKKMEKILSAPRPVTKTQVRSFLGLVGFYRRFVPRFSEIALPLTEATKKSRPKVVEWNDDCERAFKELKQTFCKAPICCLPDLEQRFVLRTDASGTGLGALLLQDHGQGLQPVACASKKLLPAEKNYSTVEKELLGIVWGVQKFTAYLYGREFTLQSDHEPLIHLQNFKATNARLMRWALQLQSFAFRFEAIPGHENVGADFLSRLE